MLLTSFLLRSIDGTAKKTGFKAFGASLNLNSCCQAKIVATTITTLETIIKLHFTKDLSKNFSLSKNKYFFIELWKYVIQKHICMRCYKHLTIQILTHIEYFVIFLRKMDFEHQILEIWLIFLIFCSILNAYFAVFVQKRQKFFAKEFKLKMLKLQLVSVQCSF